MISLGRIVEQYGAEGQYYDLGRDFASFRRSIDGANEQVKQRFEQAIGAKLNGKRVRARASRGYKQYVKDYEFDVTKVTLDDYYDNYVVVAHDNSTPKAKEYFLKPGFKIQILGPATGQPSPQKGGGTPQKPQPSPTPTQPQQEPDAAQHQAMALAPAGRTPSEEPAIKEGSGSQYYDAYSIDSIGQDVKGWLPSILLKPNTAIRDFIQGLGWMKDFGRGTSVAMFDLKIPSDMVKPNVSADHVKQMIQQAGKPGTNVDIKYDLVKMEPDRAKGEWNLRIKKTMTDKTGKSV